MADMASTSTLTTSYMDCITSKVDSLMSILDKVT
jgi:hypothetical protein